MDGWFHDDLGVAYPINIFKLDHVGPVLKGALDPRTDPARKITSGLTVMEPVLPFFRKKHISH